MVNVSLVDVLIYYQLKSLDGSRESLLWLRHSHTLLITWLQVLHGPHFQKGKYEVSKLFISHKTVVYNEDFFDYYYPFFIFLS